jgi:hypothetical protein
MNASAPTISDSPPGHSFFSASVAPGSQSRGVAE